MVNAHVVITGDRRYSYILYPLVCDFLLHRRAWYQPAAVRDQTKHFSSMSLNNASCSWNWRKLSKLRSIARQCVQIVIDDGQATFLWQDWWKPLGPLLQVFSPQVLNSSRALRKQKCPLFLVEVLGIGLIGLYLRGEVMFLINAVPPQSLPIPGQSDSASGFLLLVECILQNQL